MKKLIFTLSVFANLYAFGQFTPLIVDSATQINIQSNTSLYSNTLPFGITSKFVYGGEITKELKDNGQSNLKSKNLVAVSTFNDFKYLSGTDTKLGKGYFWGFSFGFNGESFNNLASDFYNLTFYGNKPYAGKTMDFSNTQLNLLSYSFATASIGKEFKLGKGSGIIQLDGNLYIGHSLVAFNLDNGNLFTESSGDYLDIELKGSIVLSDTTNLTSAGIGAGGNIKLGYKNSKSKIQIEANNLGAINWTTSMNSTIDTSFRFEGLVIEDIFNFSDSVISKLNLDTLNKSSADKSVSRALPIDLSLYASHKMGILTLDAYVLHRLNANFSPFAKLGANVKLGLIRLGAGLGYGGYSTFHPGINFGMGSDNFNFTIGSHNLMAVFGTQTQSSANLFLNLKLKFH